MSTTTPATGTLAGPSDGGEPGGELGSFLRQPFTGRTWAELLYVLVGLPLGVLGFVYVVTALAVGIGLAIMPIGIPLLAVSLLGARGLGALHRGLGAGLLGERGGPVSPPPKGRGVIGWVIAMLRDTTAWRTMGYLLVMFPWAIVSFVLSVAFWVYGLASLTYPLWFSWVPEQYDDKGVAHRGAQLMPDYYLDTWPRAAVVAAAGIVLLLVAPWVVRGVVSVDRLLMRGLLIRS